MADIAHSYGATIEAELGHVGDNEGSAEGEPGDENPEKNIIQILKWQRILWRKQV